MMEKVDSLKIFSKYAQRPEEDVDLARASLAFSLIEYPELDLDEEMQRLAEMADEVRERLPESADVLSTIKTVCHYLFEEQGFKGNSNHYYDPQNSFLNRVLDRRMGIPISLSVLTMEMFRRIKLPLVGVAMPGHFLVKYEDAQQEYFIDAFNNGALLDRENCRQRFEQNLGETTPFKDDYLEPTTKRRMLVRMLYNLKSIYATRQQTDRTLEVVDRILLLMPDSLQDIRDRGLLRAHEGDLHNAVADLEDYMERFPEAPDANFVKQQAERLRRKMEGD